MIVGEVVGRVNRAQAVSFPTQCRCRFDEIRDLEEHNIGIREEEV